MNWNEWSVIVYRNSVDLAYKRFEEEEYEWEEKSVKIHFVEPDMDMRSEKDVLHMMQHVDTIAIFLGQLIGDVSSSRLLFKSIVQWDCFSDIIG